MRGLSRPAAATVAGVLTVLAATGITLGVRSNGSSGANTSAGSTAICERIAVPAYFSSPYWETAIHSADPPADLILDVDGTGAGNSPDKQLQGLVRQALAAGITVLGYSSTVDGERPLAQVEADVRHYAKWYGVHSIFLDRVSGQPAQVSYYKTLAAYIHHAHPGAQVWLNPGDYPDQRYMAIGDVVMVFEGSYAQYLTAVVPSWVQSYPAAKFAHTIFATPGNVLNNALELAKQRRAGHIYVTDLVDANGANPYQGLPNYWAAEDAEATAGCGVSG
jgi:Spherulation-specific family 4